MRTFRAFYLTSLAEKTRGLGPYRAKDSLEQTFYISSPEFPKGLETKGPNVPKVGSGLVNA